MKRGRSVNKILDLYDRFDNLDLVVFDRETKIRVITYGKLDVFHVMQYISEIKQEKFYWLICKDVPGSMIDRTEESYYPYIITQIGYGIAPRNLVETLV